MWKKMIDVLSKLPNRLVVPDLLGYGSTSKPTDPKEYAWSGMTQDLFDIVEAEEIAKVIPVGHDWGSAMAARFYNFHPELCVGLVLLAVAYVVPDKKNGFDLDAFNTTCRQVFGYPAYEYWKLFTDPGPPKFFVDSIERVYEVLHGVGTEAMKEMFCVPDAMRTYLSDHSIPSRQIRAYAQDPTLRDSWQSKMKAGGFAGSFCWYRAYKDNLQHGDEKKIEDENLVIKVPLLFINYAEDNVCRVEMMETAKGLGLVPDLRTEVVESGHWGPLEKPEETARLIVDFIEKKDL